jgi:hypothetical protein
MPAPSIPMDTIDISETYLFNPKEWIGVGKKYKDVPLYISLARTEATAIPSDIKNMLPRKDETIDRLKPACMGLYIPRKVF